MIDPADLLAIPAMFRIPQAERAAMWLKNPPTAAPSTRAAKYVMPPLKDDWNKLSEDLA